MKILREYAWAFWAGGAISVFTDINMFQWEYYAYLVPLCIFLVIKEESGKKNN